MINAGTFYVKAHRYRLWTERDSIFKSANILPFASFKSVKYFATKKKSLCSTEKNYI